MLNARIILVAFIGVFISLPQTTFAAIPNCGIYASRTAIYQGDSILIEWKALQATSVAIDAFGVVAQEGFRLVSPQVSTTYHLFSANSDGQCTHEVRIAVYPLPPTPTQDNWESAFSRFMSSLTRSTYNAPRYVYTEVWVPTAQYWNPSYEPSYYRDYYYSSSVRNEATIINQSATVNQNIHINQQNNIIIQPSTNAPQNQAEQTTEEPKEQDSASNGSGGAGGDQGQSLPRDTQKTPCTGVVRTAYGPSSGCDPYFDNKAEEYEDTTQSKTKGVQNAADFGTTNEEFKEEEQTHQETPQTTFFQTAKYDDAEPQGMLQLTNTAHTDWDWGQMEQAQYNEPPQQSFSNQGEYDEEI